MGGTTQYPVMQKKGLHDIVVFPFASLRIFDERRTNLIRMNQVVMSSETRYLLLPMVVNDLSDPIPLFAISKHKTPESLIT